MANETVTPILPCVSIKATLDFYRALGFVVTLEQSDPYEYASVCYNDIRLDFHPHKKLKPAESYSICYINVSDVDALHAAFISGVEKAFGKRLSKGMPRVTSVNDVWEDRRFEVIDPAGNRLIFGQPLDATQREQRELRNQPAQSRLEQTVEGARIWAHSKGDVKGAARMIDVALSKNESVPEAVRLRALVVRADLAILLDDLALAKQLWQEVQGVQLPASEQLLLKDELQRLAELEVIGQEEKE